MQPAKKQILSSAKVREAGIQDIRRILELGKELLGKSVYAGTEVDDIKFKRACATLIGSKMGCVFVVVDEGNIAQGFILGMVDDLFFSKSKYATDLATYVTDEFRMLAPFMIRRFITWAKSKGVSEITLGISSGIGDTQRVGRLYERLGFSPVGGMFAMKIGG